MKMVVHSPTIMLVASNLDLFCDVEILQSLVCFVPMLESMNALMKFAQLCDVFICDFVAMVKICENNLNRLYVDHVVPFTNELFSRLPCTNGNKS
jgi:hypothetical protein